MYYIVIFPLLEKDFPEDKIYGNSKNLHYTWVSVLTRKHITFWSWAVLDIPQKNPLKGNNGSFTHLLRFPFNFQLWLLPVVLYATGIASKKKTK
jgi:hypothetical protein